MVREAGLFDLDERRRKLSEVGDPLVRLRQHRLQRDPDALAAPANCACLTQTDRQSPPKPQSAPNIEGLRDVRTAPPRPLTAC
jgi:hypothetical protein